MAHKNRMANETPAQPSPFAKVLRDLLDETRAYRRSEWAAILGVTPEAISQWVNDRTIPRATHLRRILDVLESRNCSAEALVAFHEISKRPACDVSKNGVRMYPTISDYIHRSRTRQHSVSSFLANAGLPTNSVSDELEVARIQRSSLVAFALEASQGVERSGISDFLKGIAKAVNSEGCILWQLSPLPRYDEDLQSGHLFVLAEWFGCEASSFNHRLPLRSVTGRAIRSKSTGVVDDVRTNPLVDHSDPLLKRVKSFVSIPVKLPGDATYYSSTLGAVNVYRCIGSPQPSFSHREIGLIEDMSKMLTTFYESTIDRASYKLMRDVSCLEDSLSTGPFPGFAEGVCRRIAKAIDALEVSLFLEDSPGCFKSVASVSPRPLRIDHYVPAPNSLTGWILAHRASVKIFDLANVARDQQYILEAYPQLPVPREQDDHFVEFAVEYFEVASKSHLRPLMFIGVPVMVGNKLLGALRCCTAMRAPYCFSHHDEELLSAIARRLGQAWINWGLRKIQEVK